MQVIGWPVLHHGNFILSQPFCKSFVALESVAVPWRVSRWLCPRGGGIVCHMFLFLFELFLCVCIQIPRRYARGILAVSESRRYPREQSLVSENRNIPPVL